LSTDLSEETEAEEKSRRKEETEGEEKTRRKEEEEKKLNTGKKEERCERVVRRMVEYRPLEKKLFIRGKEDRF
jgi:hypothetical protein